MRNYAFLRKMPKIPFQKSKKRENGKGKRDRVWEKGIRERERKKGKAIVTE